MRGSNSLASGANLLFGTRQANKIPQIQEVTRIKPAFVMSDREFRDAIANTKWRKFNIGKPTNVNVPSYLTSVKWVASSRKISGDTADVEIIVGVRKGNFVGALVYLEDDYRDFEFFEEPTLDELLEKVNHAAHDTYWVADEFNYQAKSWADEPRESWFMIDRELIASQIT